MTASRTIRLFLSSTFRDFGEERDLLVRQVFPALRARLKDRFVELVDVDLRWGITVDQAERGEVLPICLAEIDRARPYFIGMLGERYGWIPPSDGFAPDLIERQPWLKKHQGGKSVTELEILHGVLNNRRMKGRAFFYFRSPGYAKTKGGDYVPASPEDRDRQRDLKRRIQASGYPVVGYRDPASLAKRLERDLWKLLDAEFPATSVPDAFEREAMRHEAYATPRRRLYLGGERYQAQLASALESGEQRVVIEGASGGGKSALLANFFEGHRKRFPKHQIHEHYLGASADAGDPHALVRRLCEFIKRQTNSSEEIESDPQKLMDSMPLWLATASAWSRKRKTRFVFVLDALNSLTDQQDLRWWPAFLPQGVHFVVSCLAGPVLQALKDKAQGLQGQSPRWKVITVKPLTKAERKNLLTTYLARFNKTLPRDLTQQVMAHPLSGNPLFIRTLAEELRLFGVHEQLTERLAHYLKSQTIDDLFEKVIERVEGDCGKKAVKATLTAIWASRAGLTEKEVLGIANLKPATWAPIRNALDEALMEADGKLSFAHDYIHKAVRHRFLNRDAFVQKAHRQLASWFSQQPIGARRAEEQAWQLRSAGDWRALIKCLCGRELLVSIYEHRGVVELAGYWLTLESTSNRRLERVLSRRWNSWTRTLDPRGERKTSDVLVDLLHHAGRLTPFTLRLAFRGLDLARADPFLSRKALLPYINMVAVLLKDRGQFTAAEPLYLEALQEAKRLGPRHRESLATRMNNLAVLYRAMDRLEEAEAMFREALEVSRQAVGEGSESHAVMLGNLVPLLRLNGRLAQALEYADRSRAILVRLRGREHPSLVSAFNNRGQLLKSMRREAQAEAAFEAALATGRRLLGPQHPTVAMILCNLADLLSDDDPEAAMLHGTEALRIRRAVLPAGHRDIAVVLEVLGDISRTLRLFDRARAFYSEAIKIVEASGTANDQARAYNALGLTEDEAGNLDNAERHYLEALRILAEEGRPHSRIALTVTNNLALVRKERGDLTGALEMAQRSLSLWRRLFPERKDRLAIAAHNVAHILEAMGQYKEAIDLCRHALRWQVSALGPSHPELIDTLLKLSALLAENAQVAEAADVLRRARDIAHANHGADDPRTGQVLYQLGGALWDLGHTEEGRAVLEKEIAIVRVHDGEQSNSLRLSLRNLGVLMRDRGMLVDSEPLLTEALAIARCLYGEASASICRDLSALGQLRAMQQRWTESKDLLQRALDLLLAGDNPDPEEIEQLREWLQTMGEGP